MFQSTGFGRFSGPNSGGMAGRMFERNLVAELMAMGDSADSKAGGELLDARDMTFVHPTGIF